MKWLILIKPLVQYLILQRKTETRSITNGDMQTSIVEAKFITKGHTGVMIPVFAYGPGAEAFSGIYQDTGIFTNMPGTYQFDK